MGDTDPAQDLLEDLPDGVAIMAGYGWTAA
jgi:hypothetical protein